MRHTFVATSLLALSACAFAEAPEVAVVRPVERELKDELMFVGHTDASTTVEIRARDSGLIEKVLFQEGTMVKKGDLLFQLDDRVRKAELDKVQAEVALAEAKLKGAEAEVHRARKLVDAKAIAQEELNKIQTLLDEAKANLQASRAALQIAKLFLERSRIVAPIDGRIGRSHVDAGNLVKADGDTLLATIVVADPLYVYFDVDDRSFLRLNKLDKDAKKTATVVPGGDTKNSYEATIDFVDNKVNVSNNTIRVRAVLPNPKGALVPGLFVKVRIPLGPPRKVLCLPATAIARTDDGFSVLVVGDKNMLVERMIQIGPSIGDLYVVEEGVKSDDKVILRREGRKAGDEIRIRTQKSTDPVKPEGPGAAKPLAIPDLPGTGPGLIVTATYAGANAQTMEETVAGPIGVQIDGMEGLVRRFHTCTDDGKMRMTLLLKKETNLDKAQVLAQNRIATAALALPEEVRRFGLNVRKRGVHLTSVAVFSPDGKHDRDFLEAYSNKRVLHELLRVPGITDATFFADTAPKAKLRVEVDKDRLRARGLTADDVTRALRTDSVLTPGLILSDSPKTAEELEKVVVKVVGEGVPIYVRDVASIVPIVSRSTLTSLDGKPCVLLLVSALADVDRAQAMKDLHAKLKELTASLPPELAVKVLEDE